jgi:hypothetical protein
MSAAQIISRMPVRKDGPFFLCAGVCLGDPVEEVTPVPITRQRISGVQLSSSVSEVVGPQVPV